ncbi:MAG: hypothetical protein BMS9Abin33_0617 [Gammaproteobacteria bacterium]|nr:MAG: hypothetical protein BMS9Abin33_0617 [Gammaproteobacteria bacterium]
MENTKSSEKRANYRDSVQIIVDVVRSDGRTVEMRARDLSRNGIFLERLNAGDSVPELGEKIQLTIRWPIETAAPSIKLTAEVMRIADEGIGVQFNMG